MVKITLCVLKLFIMHSVSCIVQFASVCSLQAWFILKINADAVWFLVTKQFADIHIRDIDTCYVVVQQTFFGEEEKRWEGQLTVFT